MNALWSFDSQFRRECAARWPAQPADQEYHVSNNVKKTGPFDVKTVEALVELMAENDLNEIHLKDGNQHIRLRRGVAMAPTVMHSSPAAPAHTVAPSKGAAPTADAAPAAAAKGKLIEIKSETVGTFY